MDQPIADKLRVQLHAHQVNVAAKGPVGFAAARGELFEPGQRLMVDCVEDAVASAIGLGGPSSPGATMSVVARISGRPLVASAVHLSWHPACW